MLAEGGAREITVSVNGELIARHDRLAGRFGVTTWSLLLQKPGALAGLLALHQERQRGRWPGCMDEFRRALTTLSGDARFPLSKRREELPLRR